MLVLKFGGSSVGSPESLVNVKKIVESKSSDCVVVVSAMNGITDSLSAMFEIAFKKGEGYMDLLKKIESRHVQIIKEVVPLLKQEECLVNINGMLDHLENILNCISVLKESSNRSRDFVMSFGELLSSQIVVSMLNNAEFVDARDLIVTDENFGSARILWQESKQRIKSVSKNSKAIKVVNGFCGKSKEGYTTSLGRGGSDLSAALLSVALSVEFFESYENTVGEDGFFKKIINTKENFFVC